MLAAATLLMLAASAAASERCFMGYKYKMDNATLPRLQAEEHCSAFGGHLASILDVREQTFVEGVVPSQCTFGVWFGLNDIKAEGSYENLDGAPTDKFANWNKGEPDGGAENDCVMMHTVPTAKSSYGAWNAFTCYAPACFVCKKATEECNVNDELLWHRYCQGESAACPPGTETLGQEEPAHEDGCTLRLCKVCGNSTYSSDGEGCLPCPVGTKHGKPGSTTVESCAVCDMGTGDPDCPHQSWLGCSASVCAPGSSTISAEYCWGNMHYNETCQACPESTYASQGETYASVCTPCPVGTRHDKIGAVSVDACLKCPFTDANCSKESWLGCNSQVCPPGTHRNRSTTFYCWGNMHYNETCAACPESTFSLGGNIDGCESCPIGTKNNVLGSTSSDDCVPCSVNDTSCPQSISTGCSRGGCPAGTQEVESQYCPDTMVYNQTCHLCAPSTYSNGGVCVACPVGKKHDIKGATMVTECQSCDPATDETCPKTSWTGCKPGGCPAGTAVKSSAYCAASMNYNYTCEVCYNSTYSTGTGECIACPFGKKHGRLGSTAQADCQSCDWSDPDCPKSFWTACDRGGCPAGSKKLQERSCPRSPFQSEECEVCGNNTYSTGATGECVGCPVGKSAARLASTSLDDCKSCDFETDPTCPRETFTSCSAGGCPAGTSETKQEYCASKLVYNETCTACPNGTYSTGRGALSYTIGGTQCRPCPRGRTNFEIGATSVAACSVECIDAATGPLNCTIKEHNQTAYCKANASYSQELASWVNRTGSAANFSASVPLPAEPSQCPIFTSTGTENEESTHVVNITVLVVELVLMQALWCWLVMPFVHHTVKTHSPKSRRHFASRYCTCIRDSNVNYWHPLLCCMKKAQRSYLTVKSGFSSGVEGVVGYKPESPDNAEEIITISGLSSMTFRSPFIDPALFPGIVAGRVSQEEWESGVAKINKTLRGVPGTAALLGHHVLSCVVLTGVGLLLAIRVHPAMLLLVFVVCMLYTLFAAVRTTREAQNALSRVELDVDDINKMWSFWQGVSLKYEAPVFGDRQSQGQGSLLVRTMFNRSVQGLSEEENATYQALKALAESTRSKLATVNIGYLRWLDTQVQTDGMYDRAHRESSLASDERDRHEHNQELLRAIAAAETAAEGAHLKANRLAEQLGAMEQAGGEGDHVGKGRDLEGHCRQAKKDAERLSKERKAMQHAFDVRLTMLIDVLAAKINAIATMTKLRAESKAKSIELKGQITEMQIKIRTEDDAAQLFYDNTMMQG